MPSSPIYPGIYIEEVAKGVRTIVGVSTSITAFIGRAMMGPMDVPVTILSFADYIRIFGGLWTKSSMSFAVSDFFENGGSQAVIVRVHNRAKPATFRIPTTKRGQVLKLEATNPGAWGMNLRVSTSAVASNDFTLAAELLNPATQLIVHGESFLEVSLDPDHPRFLPLVLERESELVKAITVNGKYSVPTSISIAKTSSPLSASGKDGSTLTKTQILRGLAALDQCDQFNILCIPPYRADGNVDKSIITAAAQYCERRRAFYIVDSPNTWTDVAKVKAGYGTIGTTSANTALYFPQIKQPNPLKNGEVQTFASCGAVAGVFARTDATRGVWKAPAGTEASIAGVSGLSVNIADPENAELNPLGINSLRIIQGTRVVVWGARTFQGADALASEWKYVPVRRTALFIEESLYRGLRWVVFEPNDEPLWAQIRLNVGAFLHNLFRAGAFPGQTPKDAYFVKCDGETITQTDINSGIINVVAGFAPLKPAEFVIIKLQLMAGHIEV